MEAQPVGGVFLIAPTDAAGEAPAGSGPRTSLSILFLVLCISFGMLLHTEQLAAAAAKHLCPVVVVVFFVTVFFNLAIFSLSFLVARGRAAGAPRLLFRPTARAGAAPAVFSESKSPLTPFIGLCLAMGAALHAESLAAAATEYQIGPAVVVCVVLPAVVLFHLAVLSIHKTLASQRAEDEPKQLARSRGLPLLPFVALALAISAADVATDLPQDASVWAALALAISFNIAIGSLYCFIIGGPPLPTAATVEP